MKKTLVLLLILVMTLSLAAPAFAEWVPDKEIKCIVPFGPGGGSDILSRTLIEYMDLPVDMVVVNIEGGAGLVGAQETAVAEPDGYTILAHQSYEPDWTGPDRHQRTVAGTDDACVCRRRLDGCFHQQGNRLDQRG